MDKNTQQEVTLACIALLQQNAADEEKARKRNGLPKLAKRRDIPWADTVEAAFLLCRLSPRGSEEHQQAVEMLQEQSHWPDATAAQAQEAIIALSHAGGYRSKEWYLAIQMLLELTHWPDPTFEDALVIDDNGVSLDSGKALIRKQQAAKEQMWKTVAQRPDLTSEQRLQVDQILQNYQNWLALKV